MHWNKLSDINQLEEIDKQSNTAPVLIFKHSTRCSISSMALNRLERNWKDEDSIKLNPYYLDLIQHRDISNAIAERYGVVHESPQVLVIKNGKAEYDTSHSDIAYSALMELT